MNQFQSFAVPQPPTVAEYAFPSVLQFLQSEWRRFERDRNEWDIEKAEMKARIAFLEGEKRGVDNTKIDLMKRVKMLEYALRQERSKYVEGAAAAAAAAATAAGLAKDATATTTSTTAATGNMPASNGNSNSEATTTTTNNNNNSKVQNRMSTYSASGHSMTQTSPTSATSLDPVGRAKSREFLRICLQEISYLTSSVPQSIAAAMPPVTNRLSRHESDKKPFGLNGIRGGGGRNRHSDFFPNNALPVQPPPLPRSNSVPVATLQSLSQLKANANSPPLDPDMANVAGPIAEEPADQATLKQTVTTEAWPAKQQQRPSSPKETLTNGITASTSLSTNKSHIPTEPMEQVSVLNGSGSDAIEDHEAIEDGLGAFQQEEAITVVHSPISEEHWQAQLQKAGQQLAQKGKGKKNGTKVEDEAQLSKDVQDKFNISPERINKMVKDWDKSKVQDAVPANQKSIRKKKTKDASMLDDLENLSMADGDALGAGTKEGGDSLANEPARWRPKVTLKRHMDTVRSIAFHPDHKALLSGSEDGTMKYWNLESSLRESKRPANSEVDPIHTYRGHTKPITAVAISAHQDKCFSASMDSTVRAWKMVPMKKETYERLDPSLSLASFIGHTDSVWDIRLFPLSISSSQLLASISADGALKIWDTETKGSPLRSSWGYHGLESMAFTEPVGAYTSGLAKLPVPTSLDFCPTDLKKMVVSYSNSVIKLFDIETGKEILAFKSDATYDGSTATQINKLVCHPTMPLVVSGHEDRYIRFFDINSGACSFSMLSHLDAVSSLDIDPSGLVLCSGGHDASVRLWDMASSSRACLQEFTGHRRKSDEGVCTVKYHPTLPGLMATGGADAIVKVYTRC